MISIFKVFIYDYDKFKLILYASNILAMLLEMNYAPSLDI
jgi:hypothetical protein